MDNSDFRSVFPEPIQGIVTRNDVVQRDQQPGCCGLFSRLNRRTAIVPIADEVIVPQPTPGSAIASIPNAEEEFGVILGDIPQATAIPANLTNAQYSRNISDNLSRLVDQLDTYNRYINLVNRGRWDLLGIDKRDSEAQMIAYNNRSDYQSQIPELKRLIQQRGRELRTTYR
jgi:hypothetical protein